MTRLISFSLLLPVTPSARVRARFETEYKNKKKGRVTRTQAIKPSCPNATLNKKKGKMGDGRRGERERELGNVCKIKKN